MTEPHSIRGDRPNKLATFDVIRLREQIRLGQRVDAFGIDAWSNGAWKEIHAGKTIGNQVLVRLSQPVTTDRLRLRITESAGVPCISEFSLFKMPAIQPTATDAGSPRKTFPKRAGKSSPPPQARRSMPSTGIRRPSGTPTWRRSRIRRSPSKWISATTSTFPPSPTCRARTAPAHGMTDKYRFELSRDGKRWVTMAEGEFSNIRANPIEQTVPLKKPVSARYLRFTGLHALEKNHVSAAEIGVIAAP